MTPVRPVLRPYQQRVTDAVFSAWDAGMMRPAISMATGGGKTVVFSEIIRRHLDHHRDRGPAVVLAHRKELITQAAQHLRRVDPDMRVETVIGSPGDPGTTKRARAVHAWRHADVLVTTVQTLSSRQTLAMFPDPSLVIADESHHAAANSWTNVLHALGCWTGTRALGVTATPFREDYREFSDVWQGVVASVDISWLIAHGLVNTPEGPEEWECHPGEGYLIPPTLRHLLVDGLDLSMVPTSRKSGAVDFREGELADEMHRVGAFDHVAKTVTSELGDRKGVLFAPTVASSQYLAGVLSDSGAPCHHVDGSMKPADRDAVLNDFRAGKVRWLSNVNIVSEGFDLPDIDAVVLARPTQSRIFFRQSIGRALRPSPGKHNAIVLDVAGVSDGHSLAGVEALTDTDVLTAGEGEGLTELLDRSARERRGRFDRIDVHRREAHDLQQRAERAAEQVKLTAEGLGDQLPGAAMFAERAAPLLSEVQDFTTHAADRAIAASPDQTLDELADTEEYCARELADARRVFARLDGVKTGLRAAIAKVREDPGGQLARAMVTGTAGTVAGALFGDEEARAKGHAPETVGSLKVRGAAREGKPVHPSRYGWALKTDGGAYYALVHADAVMSGTSPGVGGRSEPTAIAVAVPIPNGSHEPRWMPVWWNRGGDNGVTELDDGLWDEESAYRMIVQAAADATNAPNLLNPAAAWRKKTSQTGNGARALARRIAPGEVIPDNATSGYVSDVITHGKYSAGVDKLADWVREQST